MVMTGSGGNVQQTTASQPPGTYDISAWVQYTGLTSASGDGVRLCVSAPPDYPWRYLRACTPTFSGTSSGWVKLSLSAEIMTAQSTIMVDLENYDAKDYRNGLDG